MKINIIGRHPTIQPGFCGVMSLYESIYLAKAGHEVELKIPFSNKQEMTHLLKLKSFESLNKLPKQGREFFISPIFLDEKIKISKSDVTIWQSTSPQDWKILYPLVRAKSTVVTKNFPKFFPLHPAPISKDAQAQFETFDLVTCALKEDYQAVLQNLTFFNSTLDRVAYVPRGADPQLLNTLNKSNHPFIALDTPNTKDDCAIEHFFQPIRRLRLDFPDMEVVTLGRQISLEDTKYLSFQPFDQMYSKFLNPAWLYCVIDYGQSSPHIRGSIHAVDKRWQRKAIYEVQTVEAQMAGCVITGYRENIIPELIQENVSAVVNSFDDEDTLYDSMRNAIQNFPEKMTLIRNWAEKSFSWEESIKTWEFACNNLVLNGYDRNRIQVPLSAVSYPIAAAQHEDKKITHITAALSKDEKMLIFEYANLARRYVEFGTGGSTRIACVSKACHIESIDSSAEWIETLKNEEDIKIQMNIGRIRFHLVDIGPTREWGYPIIKDDMAWLRYSKSPWNKFPVDDVDFVLVYGRFRVACAMEAALRLHQNCRIAVDDYKDRPHYNMLESILDIEVSGSKMVIFRKGNKWNVEKAYEILENYRLDPS